MKDEGWPIPEGFNARTKLTPDWSNVEKELKEELRRVEEEVRRKCKCGEGKEKKGLKRDEESVREDGGRMRRRSPRKHDQTVWGAAGRICGRTGR